MGIWNWIVETLPTYPELDAIGNTLLTIFGMVIVPMMAGGSWNKRRLRPLRSLSWTS